MRYGKMKKKLRSWRGIDFGIKTVGGAAGQVVIITSMNVGAADIYCIFRLIEKNMEHSERSEHSFMTKLL